MCTDVSSIAKLAEAVSAAKNRWRMALIPNSSTEVDQPYPSDRHSPTIGLGLMPMGTRHGDDSHPREMSLMGKRTYRAHALALRQAPRWLPQQTGRMRRVGKKCHLGIDARDCRSLSG